MKNISLKNLRPFTFVGVFLSLLFLYTMVRFSMPLHRSHGLIPNDFFVFFNAVDRFEKGQAIYQASDASPFKYSPAFLMVFKNIFAPLGPEKAWFLYCLASLCAWFGALYLVFKNYFSAETKSLTKFYLLFFAGLLASWHGFLEHLSYGQADFFIASLAVFSTWFYSKSLMLQAHTRRMAALFASGTALAAALLIKPTALLLFSGLAWTGGVAVIFLGGFLALCLLLLAGLANGILPNLLLCKQWISSLGQQPQILFSGNLNQNIGAALARDLQISEHAEVFSKVTLTLGLLVFGICLLRGLKQRSQQNHVENHTGAPGDTWALPLAMSMAFYLCVTPLSWRWMTFLWWPLTIISGMRKPPSMENRTLAKICLGAFAIIALLLQAVVAHALGIEEVDTLSYWGLYGWGSLLLLLSLFV